MIWNVILMIQVSLLKYCKKDNLRYLPFNFWIIWNVSTYDFYETQILKAINIFNFQMKNKLKMMIQVPMKTTISKQHHTD